MNTNEMRELTLAELEQVSGGVDGTGNWQSCRDGVRPAKDPCPKNAYEYLLDMIGIAERLGARV